MRILPGPDDLLQTTRDMACLSKLVNRYGLLHPRQASWILSGRGSGKYNRYKAQRPTLSQMKTELRLYMSTEFTPDSSQHLCHQIQMDHQQKGTGKHHQWSITLLISMNLDHVTQFELEDPLIIFIFSSRTSLSWGR